jgi:DNA-binding XRE family transcriptional regulator
VASRKDQQTVIRSNLAEVRVAKGVTQDELARVVGISKKSLVRLEQRRIPHPPLAWYVNCAIALGVRLERVLDDGDLDWRRLDIDALKPPRDWIKKARAVRPAASKK